MDINRIDGPGIASFDVSGDAPAPIIVMVFTDSWEAKYYPHPHHAMIARLANQADVDEARRRLASRFSRCGEDD